MNNVNHPDYYNTGKIEVIDYIEDKHLGFHLGNAIKYISRAGLKNKSKAKEDIEKAIWYLQRYIEKLDTEKHTARYDAAHEEKFIRDPFEYYQEKNAKEQRERNLSAIRKYDPDGDKPAEDHSVQLIHTHLSSH